MPCPICLNADAKVVHRKKGSESHRIYSMVFCATCPVTFEIAEADLLFLDTNPHEGLARRNRWAQLLSEAAGRGETLVRLPS
jgi:hypothetical protein